MYKIERNQVAFTLLQKTFLLLFCIETKKNILATSLLDHRVSSMLLLRATILHTVSGKLYRCLYLSLSIRVDYCLDSREQRASQMALRRVDFAYVLLSSVLRRVFAELRNPVPSIYFSRAILFLQFFRSKFF